MPNLKLIQIFESIEDPREVSCNFKHPLPTILFITVVCSLCGADDWELIVVQAGAMTEWLSKFVDVSNGIPSVRTFKRVFEALSPQQLNRVLIEATSLCREKKNSEIISFDGKTMRGTSAAERGLKAIHMLNAWSHDNGICIGHVKVDDKSKKMALREDVSRGPATATSVRRGANARAAVGLRSQSKIAAQKSPEGRRGRVGTHPVFEHVIWRSKLSLKGASRGFLRVTRSALRNPRLMKKRHFFRFYKIL